VGNAVDDDGIFGGLVHPRAAELDEFGSDAVGLTELVHLDDERGRETVFAAAEKAYFLHDVLLQQISRIVRVLLAVDETPENAGGTVPTFLN
jgi:hypothetical protein